MLTKTEDEEIGKIGAGIIVYDPVEGEVLWDWSAHGEPGDEESVKTATRLRDHDTDFFAHAAGDADRMPEGGGVLVTRAVGGSFVAELAIGGGVPAAVERRWVQSIPREDEVYRAEYFPSLYETAWGATTGW